MLDIREDGEGVVFKVRVQPRAAKNQLAGLYGDALKLRLTAPPVDGEANKACKAFLAKLFKVPKNNVELLTGHTGRNKYFRIIGIDKAKAVKALNL
jgi:hypothetical protein